MHADIRRGRISATLRSLDAVLYESGSEGRKTIRILGAVCWWCKTRRVNYLETRQYCHGGSRVLKAYSQSTPIFLISAPSLTCSRTYLSIIIYSANTSQPDKYNPPSLWYILPGVLVAGRIEQPPIYLLFIPSLILKVAGKSIHHQHGNASYKNGFRRKYYN